MHRGAGGTNVLIKPPKPPCWRDFVCGSENLGTSKHLCFTDVQNTHRNRIQLISGEGNNVSSLTTGLSKSDLCGQNRSTSPRSSKQGKRARIKLHRTRSEVLIREEDLPNASLTVNLCEAKPRKIGLNMERSSFCDNRRYLEENTKRCQSWLASIEASFPLDDIRPSSSMSSSTLVESVEECAERKTNLCSQNIDSFSIPDTELPCHDVTTTTTSHSGANQVIVSHQQSRRSGTSDIKHCDKVIPDMSPRQDSSYVLDSCGFDASKMNITGRTIVR